MLLFKTIHLTNMIEIERKFLVLSENFKKEAQKQIRIKQGFLSTDKARTVRVRIKGNKGFLTIKGESSANGLSRFEWEKEISINDANDLLKLCKPTIIDKIRYEIPLGRHVFEVDEFFGENEGLTVAEVELKTENDVFETPKWLGKEITGTVKYYNSQLSKLPYKDW